MPLDDTQQTSSNDVIERMARGADYVIAQNLRFITKRNALRALRTRRIAPNIHFWDNGSLSWAIDQYARWSREDLHRLRFDSNQRLLNAGNTIKTVDNILFNYGNYDNLSPESLRAAIDFVQRSKKDVVGTILYREKNTAAFVDTLGMAIPFLVRWGVAHDDEAVLHLALRQFDLFFEHGMDQRSGLPYHGYEAARGLKCGIIGWGRGVGWMLIGLAETLRWLDKETDAYRIVARYYSDLLNHVVSYQRTDGGFSWQLEAIEGHLDTSVAAMVGFSMVSYRAITGESLYDECIEGVYSAVTANINDQGFVVSSSAECRGFSMYPQRFEINSWGQAFALLFMLGYHESK